MKAKNDKIELFSISGRSDSTLNDLSRSLEDSDEFNRSMKRRIYKNLIAFSVSFLLYSSSNSGLHALQSSLNSVNNLGLISLLSSSAASSISSFFLPVIGFKLLGFKWTAIVAQFFSISYIIANYFPGYFTLTSASIIHGISNITLWALHGSLIAALAKQYSNYSTRKPELILVKFFAISSAISHLNHIISSGISAAVLNQNGLGFGHDHDLMENYSNSSIGKVCGAKSCPSTASSIEAPPKLQVMI